MKADMVTPYVGRFVLVIIDAEFVVQGALESLMNDKSQRRIAADTKQVSLKPFDFQKSSFLLFGIIIIIIIAAAAAASRLIRKRPFEKRIERLATVHPE